MELTANADDWEESSCVIRCLDKRVRGVNYRDSYPDAHDPNVPRSGWHEHRWDDLNEDRVHHPIPDLQDPNGFREVLTWVQLNWCLEIEGLELLGPSVWEA